MPLFSFFDYSDKVEDVLTSMVLVCLEECAGELESQVKRNARVDTGQTRNSWQHRVSKESDGEYKAVVGSDYENAIWEEFGTGHYAVNGDGRKGGWAYKDPETGETIWTHGKRPTHAFQRAYNSKKEAIENHIRSTIGASMA